MTESKVMAQASLRSAFAAHHRHDRSMIAAVAATIWLAMVSGFGLDLVRRANDGPLSFPLVIHLHALVYGAWLVLLAAQAWLVRTQRATLHRRLGRAALLLLPLMLVLGPAAAVLQVVNNAHMPDRWIAWLAVQFTNVSASVPLIAAGLLWRRDAPAHKRLMLMGTIALTEPGFSRIWEPALVALWGEGLLPFYFSTYVGTLGLVFALGAYDLATRGRLHPAHGAAATWIIANEALATWLYHQPFWLGWMKAMTGHAA
jgi:hypothetical protein